MRIRRFILAASITAAVAAPAVAASNLTPDEIKSTFGTGAAIAAHTPSGMTYTLTLNADGSAQLTLLKGNKDTRTGTWRTSKTSYCSKWGKSSEKCYLIAKSGKGYAVTNKAGQVIATWKL